MDLLSEIFHFLSGMQLAKNSVFWWGLLIVTLRLVEKPIRFTFYCTQKSIWLILNMSESRAMTLQGCWSPSKISIWTIPRFWGNAICLHIFSIKYNLNMFYILDLESFPSYEKTTRENPRHIAPIFLAKDYFWRVNTCAFLAHIRMTLEGSTVMGYRKGTGLPTPLWEPTWIRRQ